MILVTNLKENALLKEADVDGMMIMMMVMMLMTIIIIVLGLETCDVTAWILFI